MRKTILILILIIIVVIMAAACEYEDHDGKVVDKVYEKEPDTYMNIGNGVSVPVFGSTNYYVVVEDDNGDRERVALKREVFDQFDKGDRFENNNDKVYKNGELIDE